MIKVETLKKLLNADEASVRKIETEKLRTIVGTLRYFIRIAERELNQRSDQPMPKK